MKSNKVPGVAQIQSVALDFWCGEFRKVRESGVVEDVVMRIGEVDRTLPLTKQAKEPEALPAIEEAQLALGAVFPLLFAEALLGRDS